MKRYSLLPPSELAPNPFSASTSTRAFADGTVTWTGEPKNCSVEGGLGPPPVAVVPKSTAHGPGGATGPAGPCPGRAVVALRPAPSGRPFACERLRFGLEPLEERDARAEPRARSCVRAARGCAA